MGRAYPRAEATGKPAQPLESLKDHPRFSYVPDQIVTRVEERVGSVRIHGYHRLSREPIQNDASRVYLAAGVIPTTQILLRSRGLYGQPVCMRDSQYFLLPFALFRGVGGVRTESLQTLSQLFLELLDPAISPHTIHLQVYSYNDLIGQALRSAMGPFAKRLPGFASALENRLMVIQGYLHSDHSSRIEVSLRREAGGEEKLRLTAIPNPQTRAIIRKVGRKLFRHSRRLGGVPLLPMLQVADAGRGFHSGGTFPMSAKPSALETDVLGRPFGWNRVHAVDATIFPSIPATTITFSVMANAHRIATATAKEGT